MKNKKIIIIPIICAALAALVAGGIFAFSKLTAQSVSVIPVSNVTSSNYDDIYLSGTVSSGKTQTVALKEGLVESVNVSVGDVVKKGDVLMKYDSTAYQIALMKDEANIELIKSNIQVSKNKISKYSSLKASEDAPAPTEIIITHSLDPVDTLSEITKLTQPSETEEGGASVFYCTPDTVVKAEFLAALKEKGETAVFRIYRNNSLHAAWVVEGSSLSGGGDAAESEDESETDADESTEESLAESTAESTSESTAESTVAGEESGKHESSETAENFTDWRVGDGLDFGEDDIGDGTVSVDISAVRYGTLYTYIPEQPGEDEIQYRENYVIDADGNYAYSKAELAAMISEEQKSITDNELELRRAELTLKQDSAGGTDGTVVAQIDGTVTEVNDVSGLETGGTLITVKGDGNYTVTVYLSESMLESFEPGTEIEFMTYETGSSFTASVTETDENPSDYYSSGMENPNNSYYAVTCTADTDVALKVGEYCYAEISKEDTGTYIPLMYVRSDDGGRYCMVMSDKGTIEKRYVSVGKTLWGSEIQIKSGLTEDDYIAFPYAKECKEGAKAEINEEYY